MPKKSKIKVLFLSPQPRPARDQKVSGILMNSRLNTGRKNLSEEIFG